jgi:hypothetical protein
MNHHRLSSVQLTQFYLTDQEAQTVAQRRIIDSPTALADARKADKARRWGPRPPLRIPVLLKDNVNDGHADDGRLGALAGSSPSDVHRPATGPRARSSSARPTSPSGRTDPLVVERGERHRRRSTCRTS